jgi:rhodanese-related sulfurtransferase
LAIPQLDVNEAADRLAGKTGGPGPLLVDVRETNELLVVRVPGAVHVPLSDFANASARLPTDRPLLFLCASGRRSLVAAEYLQRHGASEVANVTGGIIEWQKRGLPTMTGPLAEGEARLPEE